MFTTLSRRFLMSAFSAWTASFSRSTICRSWYGCWLSSSRMRWFRRSICVLVRSLIARWASRSFARFRASCSGVRFATPREVVAVRRFFEAGWPASAWLSSSFGTDEGELASLGGRAAMAIEEAAATHKCDSCFCWRRQERVMISQRGAGPCFES